MPVILAGRDAGPTRFAEGALFGKLAYASTQRKVWPNIMNFKAVQVLCMAVSTLIEEMTWASYGKQELHTPVITDEEDCHKLDLLMDMMGTLTRMMDTRINYVTTEGKVIREWIQSILEVGGRYRRELEILEKVEKQLTCLESKES